MKYEIIYTNQFKRDLKKAKKQNKNLDRLFEVVEKLANRYKFQFRVIWAFLAYRFQKVF